MKFNLILILLISSFLYGCTGAPSLDSYRREDNYIVNNLSYPVKVQAYCYKISNTEDWCKTPVPFSDPIEIPPGDTAEVIRYTPFESLKVYRAEDDVLMSNPSFSDLSTSFYKETPFSSDYKSVGFISSEPYPFEDYMPVLPSFGHKATVDNSCNLIPRYKQYFSMYSYKRYIKFNLNHPDFAIEEVEE